MSTSRLKFCCFGMFIGSDIARSYCVRRVWLGKCGGTPEWYGVTKRAILKDSEKYRPQLRGVCVQCVKVVLSRDCLSLRPSFFMV